MAARPLPIPEPAQTSKKARLTVANALAIRKQLNAVIKKRWFPIAGIAVAVFLVILVALPFLINVNSFRPRIESELSSTLGRRVTIGNLSLSILLGRVGVDNIAIADDPAFGTAPFITAGRLKVGVELMPLIWSKQLKVTDITLEQPQITLLKTTTGKWNFSSIVEAGAKKSPEPSSSGGLAPTNLAVAKLKKWKVDNWKSELFGQTGGL